MRRTSRRPTSRRFRPNALRERTLYTIHTVYETPSGETKISRDTWIAKFGKPTNSNLAKIVGGFSEGRVISAEVTKPNGDVLASWGTDLRHNAPKIPRLRKGDEIEVTFYDPADADPAPFYGYYDVISVQGNEVEVADLRTGKRKSLDLAEYTVRSVEKVASHPPTRRRTSRRLRANAQNETREIKVYYEIVTPESAEEGDVAETGELEPIVLTHDDLDEDEPSWVDAAVRAISNNAGALEADAYGRGAVPSWFIEIDGSTDYRTGANTRRSFIPKGFTPEEMVEMGRRLTRRY